MKKKYLFIILFLIFVCFLFNIKNIKALTCESSTDSYCLCNSIPGLDEIFWSDGNGWSDEGCSAYCIGLHADITGGHMSCHNSSATFYTGSHVCKIHNATSCPTGYTSSTGTEYTLTYDNNGGSGCTSQTASANTIWGNLCTPTRTGYRFTGWNTARDGSGASVVASTSASRDMTVYAQWVELPASTYTLTYDSNGGSTCTPSSVTATANSAWGTLCSPTRSGYTFDGWYTAKTGGSRVTSSSLASDNITVYAHWNDNSSYKCYACVASQGVTYTWTSSTLTNCQLQSGVTTQTECQNRNTTYTLTYDNNGGSGCISTTAFKGSTWGTLCTPTRSGYAFTGWWTSASGGTKVSSTFVANGNTTVYAHWITAPAANNCVCGTPSNENTFHTESCGTYSSCTEVCNNFGQSLIAGTCSGQAACTLSYDSKGGTTCDNATIGCGNTLNTLCTPTRSCYRFDGWYTAASGGSQFTTSTKLNENTTVYAHWTYTCNPTPTTYTLTYDSNGGSTCTPATKTATSGSAWGELCAPTRENYTFKGWYTSSTEGTQVTASTIATGNITVHAHWTSNVTDNKNDVIFDCNGGSGTMAKLIVIFGQSVTLTQNACVREGYAFKEWKAYAKGNAMLDSETGSEITYADKATFTNVFGSEVGDITLKAQWTMTKTTYVVHFNANGGSGTMSDLTATKDVKGNLTANAFTYKDHTFNGWKAYITNSSGRYEVLKNAAGKDMTFANKGEFENLYGPNYEEVTLFAQWKPVNPKTGIVRPTIIVVALIAISGLGYFLVKKKGLSF